MATFYVFVKAQRKSNFFAVPDLIRDQDPRPGMRTRFGTILLDSGFSLRSERNDSGEEAKVANLYSPLRWSVGWGTQATVLHGLFCLLEKTLTNNILNLRITYCYSWIILIFSKSKLYFTILFIFSFRLDTYNITYRMVGLDKVCPKYNGG